MERKSKKKSTTRKTSTRKSTTRKSTARKTSARKSTTRSGFGSIKGGSDGGHLAFGVFSKFGSKFCSSFGNNGLLIMPFGPGGRWLEQGHEGAASSAAAQFGSASLAGRNVNPSGYLSTWYGQPRTPPPSWNPLLLQGHNTFREGIDSPRLSNVVSGFGKRGSAMHTDKRNSKGWAKVARSLDRSSLPKRCFLGRGTKYPVCDADEKFDCRGLMAAMQRSRKGTKVHKRALALGRKHGCAWA